MSCPALPKFFGPAARGPVLPLLSLLALALLLSGCKLVEFKMPGEPLSKADRALRIQTREFAAGFAAAVQLSADQIARQNPDPQAQADVVRWKIGAIGAVRKSALRTSPTSALVDTWVFCRQMSDFFDHGAGAHLFGEAHSLALTNALAQEEQIAGIAGTILPAAEWRKMKPFIAGHALKFPLLELGFERESATAHWEQVAGQTNVPPAGTTADALADFADRLQFMGEQLPAEVRWRVSLETRRLDEALAETEQTLRNLDAGLKRIAETAATAPGSVSNAVLELRAAFLPVLERFEKQWAATLDTLTRERAALARDIATERAAVVQTVVQQRAAVMKDVERMAGDLADRSLLQARAMVKDVLRYALLLALVVLGLPFVFGFLAGRISARVRRDAARP